VLDSERRFWEDEVTDSACVGGNMSSVQEPHLHLEVGHILFLDIVRSAGGVRARNQQDAENAPET
jgi:hypothetical protein